jgi:phage terminase small subunit
MWFNCWWRDGSNLKEHKDNVKPGISYYCSQWGAYRIIYQKKKKKNGEITEFLDHGRVFKSRVVGQDGEVSQWIEHLVT